MARRPVVALICLWPGVGEELEAYLDRRGYDVRHAAEEWEARAVMAAGQLDVVVVGERLPTDTALELVRRLPGREDPDVILVRPPSDVVERVLALELGAADIVDTPIVIRELVARIGGMVARRGRQGPELVALENSTVDLRSALVMHRSGEEEMLSPGQVALFRLFLANPRKVLSRDEIMAAAPAEALDAFDRSIDSRIVRLRRKLDSESIVTIRGSGYRFDPPG